MNLKKYLDKSRITLNINANSKKEIIEELANMLLSEDIVEEGHYKDVVEELISRENVSSTGMQDGIAIPHVKSQYIKKLSLVVGISKEGKDFSSLDGEKSHIFFLIVSPKDSNRLFMKILSTLAGISCVDEEKLEKLINSKTKEEIIELLSNVEEDNED